MVSLIMAVALSYGTLQRQQEERQIKCIKRRRNRCILTVITDKQLTMGEYLSVFTDKNDLSPGSYVK